jgi:hypothetical protein
LDQGDFSGKRHAPLARVARRPFAVRKKGAG